MESGKFEVSHVRKGDGWETEEWYPCLREELTGFELDNEKAARRSAGGSDASSLRGCQDGRIA